MLALYKSGDDNFNHFPLVTMTCLTLLQPLNDNIDEIKEDLNDDIDEIREHFNDDIDEIRERISKQMLFSKNSIHLSKVVGQGMFKRNASLV